MLSRRHLLHCVATGAVVGTAGCAGLLSSDSDDKGNATEPADPAEQPPAGPGSVSGTVVDLSEDGVADASIRAIAPGTDASASGDASTDGEPDGEADDATVAEATTDEDGGFELDPVDAPVWLRVTASEFVDRTVAAAPGATRRIQLTPREGTVSLSFGGDVMFGRRFYEDDDALEPHFRIGTEDRTDAHRTVLQYVAPLLETADVSSVNLETPLTTTDWRHPSKLYTFVSRPEAAPALADVGVDYAALGNNHVLDALTPGLDDTLAALDGAGLAYSGAGYSSDAAWEPSYVEEQGVTVGLLSCTNVAGTQYEFDWSADDTQSATYTVTSDEVDGDPDGEGNPDDDSVTVPGDVGVARATEERVSEAVDETASNADVTVVQIHGGDEYERTQTDAVETLADAAIAAGADLVVCHHPHVTGGLERRDGALVAWSLGNLAFDQEFWSTFPSYLLTVHVSADGVRRAYVDPLIVEGYVPKGVVGKPRDWQLRGTAALSSEAFSLAGETLQYVADAEPSADAESSPADGRTLDTETRTLDGDGTVYAREHGWVSGIESGASSVELGRDQLPTGTFDDPDVDDRRHEGPLWRFSRGEDSNGTAFGHDGGGVQLTRTADNSQRSILTPAERVPLSGSSTITGMYRHESDARLELLVRWYGSRSDSAIDSASIDLDQTEGWERFEQSFESRGDADYVRFYLRLYPPEGGDERAVQLDDLRLLEWADAGHADGAGGPTAYDHLRLDGEATVEFASSETADAEIAWPELGDASR